MTRRVTKRWKVWAIGPSGRIRSFGTEAAAKEAAVDTAKTSGKAQVVDHPLRGTWDVRADGTITRRP